jgi:hypothetical protein
MNIGRCRRLGAEAGGQPFAALQRAVGHGHAPGRARGKVRGHQFDHLAGTDEQHVDVRQPLEQL